MMKICPHPQNTKGMLSVSVKQGFYVQSQPIWANEILTGVNYYVRIVTQKNPFVLKRPLFYEFSFLLISRKTRILSNSGIESASITQRLAVFKSSKYIQITLQYCVYIKACKT